MTTRRLPVLGISAALAVAVTLASTVSSAAAVKVCLDAVDQALDELAIGQDERREISVLPQIVTTRDGGYVIGYDAWVRLHSCSGALIVDMRRTCKVKQTYTRGDCQIEGTKNY